MYSRANFGLTLIDPTRSQPLALGTRPTLGAGHCRGHLGAQNIEAKRRCRLRVAEAGYQINQQTYVNT